MGVLGDSKRELAVLFWLIMGLVLTLIGLGNIGLVSPWRGNSLRDLSFIVVFFFVLVASLPAKWVIAFTLWGWAVYILALAGTQALVAPLVVALASFYVGSQFFRFINQQSSLESSPTVPIQLSVGLALILLVFQLLVRLPINYSFVYWVVFSIPAIIAAKNLLPKFGSISNQDLGPFGYQERFVSSLFLIGITLHLIFALKPEIGHDGMAYRLWMPVTVSAQHVWSFDVANGINAFASNGAETMFTIGYMLGGEIAARVVNLIPFLVVLSLLYESMSTKSWSNKIMFLAVFVSTPLLGLESGNLFQELYWMLFLFAGALLAVNERIKFEVRWLAVTVLIAAGLVTKVMTVFVIPVLFALLLFQWISQSQRVRVRSWVLLGFILPLGCFPYLASYFHTGNPVFPFFNDVFKSPFFWSEEAFNNENYSQSLDWFRLLYSLNFESGKYLEARPGAFGFQWLLILPLLLTSKKAFSRSSIVFSFLCLSLFLGVFLNQAYLRYIIPILPIIVLLVSRATFDWSWKPLRSFFFALMVCVTMLNFFFFTSAGWNHSELFAFDFNEYKRRHAPEKLFWDYLSVKDPDASVLMIGRFYGAGASGSVSGDNWYFYENFLKTRSADFSLVGFMKNNGYEYLVTSFTEIGRRPTLKGQIDRDLDVEWALDDYVLYVLPERSRFQTEVLGNPDFQEQLAPWRGEGFQFENGSVLVEGSGLLYQAVELSSVDAHKLMYVV